MTEAPYPWQMRQWRQLQQQIAQGRLPHALLLSGMRGLGKIDFAVSLIQSILCDRPTGEGRACDLCRSCSLLKAGTHPDFIRVQPEASGKPIRIDAVREVIEFLTLSPSLRGRRIVLVDAADALNVNAANSLLKTLEEPAPSALLILVSERPNSLPATVRSRCQLLRFNVPNGSEASVWLTDRLTDGNLTDVVLARAGGAPLAALHFTNEEALNQRHTLIDCLNQLSEARLDPGAVVDAHTDLINSNLLDTLSSWLRDLIRVGHGTDIRENPDYEKVLLARRERLDLPKLFECLDQAQRLRDLLGNGLNAALQFEALLIRFHAAVNK